MTSLIDIEDSIKKLNRFFSLTIIPLLGILIPNISGLIANETHSWWQLLLSYFYFIVISLIVWKGNVVFFRRIRRRYEQKNIGYFKTLCTYILVNLLYSAVITGSCLAGWHYVSMEGDSAWKPLFITATVVMLSAILINNVYELVLLGREMEETTIRYKNMEIAKVQAELEALKTQIDPHFVFNCLNTLSGLITSQPETARYFNETFANVYRYILLNRDKNLVFLEDELEFINNYFYLIQIRFRDAVSMVIDLPDDSARKFLIAPISLQMLVENAIKHNHFSRSHPMVITICLQSPHVTVVNKVKQKNFAASSYGIGLKNLKERYRLITNKEIIITNNNDEFSVKLPIIKA